MLELSTDAISIETSPHLVCEGEGATGGHAKNRGAVLFLSSAFQGRDTFVEDMIFLFLLHSNCVCLCRGERKYPLLNLFLVLKDPIPILKMILKDVCFHLVSEGGEPVRGLHPRGRQDGGVALNCGVQKIRCLPPQAAVFLPFPSLPPPRGVNGALFTGRIP